MQLPLALVSGLALATGVLAVPRALSFTTWPCNNCGSPADTVNGRCDGVDHQDLNSATCYTQPSLANQSSLVVNYALPGCTLFLYSNPTCQGSGDQTFGYEEPKNCKPIVASARAAYKVICS